MFNSAVSFVRSNLPTLAVGSLPLMLATRVDAAIPPAVATTITEYQTDTTGVIALLMAAGIIVWGAFKLGRKFGWL